MKLYSIHRIYENDMTKPRKMKSGLTLDRARAHCDDPETSSSTCQLSENKEHTAKHGRWFDSYDAEPEPRRYNTLSAPGREGENPKKPA